MTKLEMVKEMVEKGYYLFSETAEQFAERIPEAILESIYRAYMERVGRK